MTFKKFLKQLIVVFCDSFDHLLAGELGVIKEFGGDFSGREACAEGVFFGEDGVHLNEVDDALKVFGGADGDLDSDGRAEVFLGVR